MRMMDEKTPAFDASRLRVGIVVSRFNEGVTDKLLESAMEALAQCNLHENRLKVVSVAGSVEIPLALQRLAKTHKYDCLIALGAVIRGETAHHEHVGRMVADGVMRVMLDYSIPVGFGVLTIDSLEQALARTDFGAHAAAAALELAYLDF